MICSVQETKPKIISQSSTVRYAYCENNPVNLVDLWGLNAGDGDGNEVVPTDEDKMNAYKGGVHKTTVTYVMPLALDPGEGILGMNTWDVYTSVKKKNNQYELEVWAVVISGPHLRHSDTIYHGEISLNVNGKSISVKPLQRPSTPYIISELSNLVGETNFVIPPKGYVSLTLKKSGYHYRNFEGYFFKNNWFYEHIDIKELK